MEFNYTVSRMVTFFYKSYSAEIGHHSHFLCKIRVFQIRAIKDNYTHYHIHILINISKSKQVETKRKFEKKNWISELVTKKYQNWKCLHIIQILISKGRINYVQLREQLNNLWKCESSVIRHLKSALLISALKSIASKNN